MDEVIKVLSARAETVVMMDGVMAKFGDDPDDWLPTYYKNQQILIN